MQDVTKAPVASPALTGQNGPRRIFISYRQSDSAGTTGRLRDELVQTFGRDRVFRDTEEIAPGMNFVSAIEQALQNCVVLLAIIGPRWLERVKTYGSQPSDGPVDYLKWELKCALAQGVKLVPVIVEGASMPRAQDLPDELKLLAQRQCLELRDKDWRHGVSDLVALLEAELEPHESDSPLPAPSMMRPGMVSTLGVAAVAAIGIFYSGWLRRPIAGIDVAVPDTIVSMLRAWRFDGDMAVAWLVIGGFVAMAGVVAGQYHGRFTGRVGDWLRRGWVFATIAGWLVALALLLLAGFTLVAALLTALTAVNMAARWLAPGRFASAKTYWLAGLLVLPLVGALAAEVASDYLRQPNVDVAFVLPPEGGLSTDDGMRVFDHISKALKTTLRDAENVEIIPAALSKSDFQDYVISNRDVLLDLKGSKGYPRIFIRVIYSHDAESDELRLGFKPYIRPADQPRRIRLLDGWKRLPIPGSFGSSLVTLQASFELVSFLVAEHQLNLDKVQQKQVWRNFFEEFYEALAQHPVDCDLPDDRLRELLEARGGLDQPKLRALLFSTCPKDGSEMRDTDASKRAIATAVAPYADLIEP